MNIVPVPATCRRAYNNSMNKGKKNLPIWSASLILLMLAGVCFAQDDTIRVETELVRVPVSVLDRDGRYLTGLKLEDFSVYENGNKQNIEIFETADADISLILAIDVSGSMLVKQDELTKAANAFISTLRSTDRVKVFGFSDRVFPIRDFATVEEYRNRKPIKLRMDGLPPITEVYNAVNHAIDKANEAKGRTAIVILSDGIGDGPSADSARSITYAQEGNAPIYTIGFETNEPLRSKYETKKDYARRMESAEFAKVYLLNLSDSSGGRNFQIEKLADLHGTFEQIFAELSHQYTLGYYPNDAGKEGERRKIRVEVDVPNAAVRSRSEVVFKKK